MPDFAALIRERLRDAGLPPAREAEIIEEWSQHLSDRYELMLSSGSSETEALAQVVADLDQRNGAGELRRVQRPWTEPVALGSNSGGSFWPVLWQDARYALRVLRLSPGFTTVCILSLALGIGANTAIFQLLDAVRMRTLPVKNPWELALIRPGDDAFTGNMADDFAYMTRPMWDLMRAQQQGFSGVFAFGDTRFGLTSGGQVRYANGMWVSGSFFDVLGIQPLLGHGLHFADDYPGCGTPGAVISYAFWQREFGGGADVLNRTVSLDGHPVPVIGVTPAGFYGLRVGRPFDVAVPLCSEPAIRGEKSFYNVPYGWWLTAMGRLKRGWTLQRASAQLESISPALMQASAPPEFEGERLKEYLAHRLRAYSGATGISSLRAQYETPLWLLLAIAGLVLLIACANLANLMLARASTRGREIAIRLALGAARGRLVWQLLTESLLLAAAGGLAGIVLAPVLSRLLVDYLGTEDGTRIFLSLPADWRVLGFTVALAALTCGVFGLAPALRATAASPARVISLAGRGLTSSREHFGLRRALVISQIALSLVLVVGALLFADSLRRILTLDAGFQRDGILIMHVNYTALKLSPQQRLPVMQSLLNRVRALPGVQRAAAVRYTPLSGDGWNDQVVVDGTKRDPWVDMNVASDDYFRTMGTPLLLGRDFDAGDNTHSPKVAIVNQQFARKIMGAENPVGRTFRIDVYRGEPSPEYRVVGMVKDTKYMRLRENFVPIAFYDAMQNDAPEPGMEVVLRSDVDLESLVASLRRAVAEVSPAIAVDFQSFDRQIAGGLVRERLLATLSGFFGVLAAVLAMVGLYGVIAYMVVRRTNEIGIRMALGAVPGRILAMVVGEALRLLTIGLVIGAIVTIAAGRAASALLYGITPRDPLTLTAASLALAIVALAASLFPAARAARLDPIVALREE